jgi:hypothetical protein
MSAAAVERPGLERFERLVCMSAGSRIEAAPSTAGLPRSAGYH